MRLEHQSYRQEKNFIDRERLNRETHGGSGNWVPPKHWSGGIYIYIYIQLLP
jgi:hypothetical protein